MSFIDQFLNKFGYEKRDRETIPSGIIEKEFGVPSAISRNMEDNLSLWWRMYTNHPPWETCEVRPLGIPGAIGRELAQHAFSEFSVSVSGSARAEYINQQMQRASANFGSQLEAGLCLGGIALKPYPEGGKILVDAVSTGFTPTRFDGSGQVTGGVFQSVPFRQKNQWFIKLEYHSFQPDKHGEPVYVVENRAFRSGRSGGIGAQVPLSSVAEWADLAERSEIKNLEGPLFAYFKPPGVNQVEPSSPLGMSVYAGAVVDLVRQADEQWEKLRWAYHAAEPKILTDGLLDPGQFDSRLFIGGRFSSTGNLFQIFDPEVKDSAYYRGFQYILQRIEFDTGLAFGTLSDPQSVEKTATEIMAAKQRQFVTESAIQQAFQKTLDGLISAMNAWCDLGGLAPPGGYRTDYNWGDGVLDDPETKRQDMAMGLQLLNAAIIGPVEYRMRYFGEDEETARRMLPDTEDLVDEEQDEVE